MDTIHQLKTPDYLIGYAESRIGGRTENQDSYGSAETPFGFVVTVCDGMGGGPGGKTASSIAVNEIITKIIDANPDDTISNILIKAIRSANMAILHKGQEDASLRGMGSTCTVLLINEQFATLAHVGDSRIYQLSGKSKKFRTFDHSMVFDMVRQKVITEEQARLSAQSNVITRALGIKPDVEVDVIELPYESGDRFVLTTDGIHGAMPETELINMLSDRKHPLGTVTDDVATTIDGKGRNEGGGHDNLTLAIIETKINSKLKSKMSKKTKLIIGIGGVLLVLSLVLNGLLLGHDSSSKWEKMIQSQKLELDSLSNIVRQNDSIISNLKNELSIKPKTLIKADNSGAKQIEALKNENKELRRELDAIKNSKK